MHSGTTPARGVQCRKPALLVEPQLKGEEEGPMGVRLRLIPTIAAGAFPTQKLAPGRNNLRAPKQAAGAEAGEQAQPPATPLDNNAILQVGLMHASYQALIPMSIHEHCDRCPVIRL